MLQSRNCHGRVLQMGYWIYYIDIRHTVSIGFIPNELKLEFPIRLENPHVIPEDQIWAGVVPVGPSGYPFNSSYRSRNSIQYKIDLGNAIVNFARIVPDGLLVFFASHCFLDQCVGCWKSMDNRNHTSSSTIWERICKHKLPVVEPRQSALFPSAIEDKSGSGAVFFAVCHGKVSEGLYFADHAGRAVVITGLPFATTNDPKVFKNHFRRYKKCISLQRYNMRDFSRTSRRTHSIVFSIECLFRRHIDLIRFFVSIYFICKCFFCI
ncbi:unnamed protein product [Cuscuta europaea]|uniref:ATP-dependent helicase C-terminal domain-containing protein n=1 Tax=Cuscuta europaea TaxID=41803 RepID=A0A9P0YPQ6_CUSEU|nr:unnamed protein product [Cuscuta europaea]